MKKCTQKNHAAPASESVMNDIDSGLFVGNYNITDTYETSALIAHNRAMLELAINSLANLGDLTTQYEDQPNRQRALLVANEASENVIPALEVLYSVEHELHLLEKQLDNLAVQQSRGGGGV